jgi:hypothetical protein
MFNKENFVSAIFTDQDRRYVEVLYIHDDEVHPFVVDLEDAENPDTKRLLDIHDMDDILELTYQTKKEERKAFEQTVMQIAKNDGLIDHILENIDNTLFELMIDFLTIEDKKNIDKLFNFKIFLFEQEIVKNCKEKQKTAIRKAKTPMAAFKVWMKIWEENKKSTN